MNVEALKRIEECKRTKAKSLDLSELRLTEIPPQLESLTLLNTLYLSSNRKTKQFNDIKSFFQSNQ